ncbi:hypothetical protein ABZZ79_29360 [Streptomyces sp. NPDC006458]|uniref:hypothetical protein n=1 Tax=Streptomyces sp. NPDC006458 TaxID=3154302 RepID=UPI0033BF109A
MFVHGIGGLRDAVTERRDWLRALAEGARGAGHAHAVSGLTQGWLAEVRFADYSDLFLPDQGQGAGSGDLDDQVAFLDALVRDLIDELGAQAVERGDQRTLRAIEHARAQLPEASGQAQGFAQPVRLLARILTTVLQVPGLRRAAQWSSGQPLLGHLAQVSRYLNRAEADQEGTGLDARIRARLLHGTDPGRPLVVVAHSLGTVVAFEALHSYLGRVDLFVTLGSPLATGAAVLQRVRPRPARTPESVERWLNFWDRDDIVVTRPRLRPYYQGDGQRRRTPLAAAAVSCGRTKSSARLSC